MPTHADYILAVHAEHLPLLFRFMEQHSPVERDPKLLEEFSERKQRHLQGEKAMDRAEPSPQSEALGDANAFATLLGEDFYWPDLAYLAYPDANTPGAHLLLGFFDIDNHPAFLYPFMDRMDDRGKTTGYRYAYLSDSGARELRGGGFDGIRIQYNANEKEYTIVY